MSESVTKIFTCTIGSMIHFTTSPFFKEQDHLYLVVNKYMSYVLLKTGKWCNQYRCNKTGSRPDSENMVQTGEIVQLWLKVSVCRPIFIVNVRIRHSSGKTYEQSERWRNKLVYSMHQDMTPGCGMTKKK